MAFDQEFELTEARILILSRYFPEYSNAAQKALSYAKEDPSAGLLKSRQILEDICRKVWSLFKESPPPSIFEIFSDESIKDHTPKRILNRVHSLRTICNVGVHHGDTVTKDDVLMSLNLLFVLIEWYGITHKDLRQFPIAVQPGHSYYRFIEDGIKDKIFLSIVLLSCLMMASLFRFHRLLPREFSRPFKNVYEGVFEHGMYFLNGFGFSFLYSLFLVFIISIFSWIIFKRFRNQDFRSRLLAYTLMSILVFGFQYFMLIVFDFYTRIF